MEKDVTELKLRKEKKRQKIWRKENREKER